MKKRDLIKILESKGYRFERHGSNHDLYDNGVNSISIPRHNEINERLAKSIIKKLEQ